MLSKILGFYIDCGCNVMIKRWKCYADGGCYMGYAYNCGKAELK
jgi:hypothetical protein